jgi:hypothetical protein
MISLPLIPAKAGTQLFVTGDRWDCARCADPNAASPKALGPGFRRDERK